MKLGMAKFFLFIFLLIFSIAKAEEKITTIPLINLENLEPSYEEVERENENTTEILNNDIKNKSKKKMTVYLLVLTFQDQIKLQPKQRK